MKKQILITILSMVVGMMFFCNANAEIKVWQGYDNEYWSNSENWLPKGIPGPNDDVVFDINAANYCILDVNTSIHNLYIDEQFEGSLLTLEAGVELSISGDIYIENTVTGVWLNSCTIILDGPNNQSITIENHIDWSFYNLIINKPSGIVTLHSDITISNSFTFISGIIDCNGFSGPCPPPCTPPQTGGIYHIRNNFAF